MLPRKPNQLPGPSATGTISAARPSSAITRSRVFSTSVKPPGQPSKYRSSICWVQPRLATFFDNVAGLDLLKVVPEQGFAQLEYLEYPIVSDGIVGVATRTANLT